VIDDSIRPLKYMTVEPTGSQEHWNTNTYQYESIIVAIYLPPVALALTKNKQNMHLWCKQNWPSYSREA
jgi:hypothetical protein